jgi:chromosome segregation ATPase
MLSLNTLHSKQYMVLGLIASFLLIGNSASAADDKKALRAQMARIQQMQEAQQALEAEKSQVLVEKLALEGKLKEASTNLEKAKAGGRQVGSLKRELESARADNAALLEKMTAAQADHDKTVTDLQAQLKAAQEETSQLKRTLASTEGNLNQRGKALATCETKNQGLYKLNTSLLEQYEKRSCGKDWLSGGPFTQLGRVKTENDSDTFKDKFEDMRVKPVTSP